MSEFIAKRKLVVDLVITVAAILLIVYAIQFWLSYRYVTSHIVQRANSEMSLHIAAIWRYHNGQFTTSQSLAKLIATQFEQTWDAVDQQEADTRFSQLYHTKPNGETLLHSAFRDFKKHPSAGAPKGSDLNPVNRKKLAIGFDLLDRLGPVVFGAIHAEDRQLYSAFVWYPNSGITVFSPRGEWKIVDATWETIAGYPSVNGAMPENNPQRSAFWSPVYFDQDVKTWMTTFSVPIDIAGKWIATAGVDVSLEQLLTLTKNSVLPGSYNVILRNDGEIVAHPQFESYLQTDKKPTSVHPRVLALRAVVNRYKDPIVVDDPKLDFLYGTAMLPGPGLTVFMVLPRSVIRAEAFELGRISLFLGLLALLAALAGIYYALSQRVLGPIKNLHAATRKMMLGDHEVMLKPQTADELGEVTYAFGEMAERLNDRQRALKWQASHDALTDLPNRSELFDRLAARISKLSSEDRRFAVLFIDLDRFKMINDSLGHHYGDLLLREAATRINQLLPSGMELGRFGGDEFLVIVDPITASAASAEAIAAALEKPFDLANRKVQITCSIGISHFPDHGTDPMKLIQHADTAMYHAKASGRNRYAVYSGRLGEIAERNFLLESRFRDAVKNAGFRFAYQRVVDSKLHQTCGAEALLRWYDPELSYVPPDQVIALAEELGFAVEIARFTVDSAFDFLELHSNDLPGSFKLAINLSAEQFSSSAVIDHVIVRSRAAGTIQQRMEVEITESTLLIDSRIAQNHITRLASAGIDVGIDDFGTGYASLSFLQRYPIKFMKIDRSFTQMIQRSDDKLPIIEVMIDLAYKLGLRVTIEGIETAEQVAYFTQRGEMLFQGYYFGAPGTFEGLIHPAQTSAAANHVVRAAD